MIISNKKKCIFIHIYKTGGSTITHYLSPYIDSIFRSKQSFLEGKSWQASWHYQKKIHSTFKQNLPKLEELGVDPKTYFKFVFVRNPYSWLLSIWNNFYSGKSQNTVKKMTFKEFIYFIDENHEKGKNQKYYGFGTRTQSSFIKNKKGKIEFDYIGRFENYQADLKKIFKTLDIPLNQKIHRTISTRIQRENYLKFYNSKTLEIVNRIFDEDFLNFNYKKYI